MGFLVLWALQFGHFEKVGAAKAFGLCYGPRGQKSIAQGLPWER